MGKTIRNQKKKEKELKRRYGRMADSMNEYYDWLDLRPLSELDDDGFAYIMQKVKGATMLDLNETEIGNESIELLTKLEYVKELRAKGCRDIDNNSIEHIQKIKGLELLHVKGTCITIDGLLQLIELPGLKELYFSASDQDLTTEKMQQLKKILPFCTFVINGIPYD